MAAHERAGHRASSDAVDATPTQVLERPKKTIQLQHAASCEVLDRRVAEQAVRL
jgi:hypothetical protein